jgi:hypothetical protein
MKKLRKLWSRFVNWLDNNINHRTTNGHAIWQGFCDYNDSMLVDPQDWFFFEDDFEDEYEEKL